MKDYKDKFEGEDGGRDFLVIKDTGDHRQLSVKEDAYSLVDQGLNCKHCKAVIPTDAVICTNCGRNVKTGRRIRTKAQAKQMQLILSAVILVLFAGAAVFAYFYYFSNPSPQLPEKAPEKPAAETPPGEAPQPEEPKEEVAAADPAEKAPAEEAAPDPSESTGTEPATGEAGTEAVAEAGMTPPETPPAPPPPRKEVTEEEIRAKLDDTFPPIAVEEPIALIMKSGIAWEGIFKGIVEGKAVVEMEGGLTKAVALGELNNKTRALCDPDFRDKLVQSEYKRLNQPRPPTPPPTQP